MSGTPGRAPEGAAMSTHGLIPGERSAWVEPAALGELAAQLRGNPAFGEMFARARRAVWSAWTRSLPHEAARREELHAEMRALDRLEQAAGQMIADGRRAARNASTTFGASIA